MSAGNWFGRKSKRQKSKSKRQKQQRGRQLRMEELEDRRVLATFVVLNALDLDPDNNVVPGSFRQAVNLANATEGTDTIVFSDALFAAAPSPFYTSLGKFIPTITLNGNMAGGELPITESVSILGPGAFKLAIAMTGANNRIFNINDGDENVAVPVEISGLTLTGGNVIGTDDDRVGGGILNFESLTMNEAIVYNNFASQGGGGIYNAPGGRLSADRSYFRTNSSGSGGGAILSGANDDDGAASATITNSTFYLNSANGEGGGVFNRRGTTSIAHSTFDNNSAEFGGAIASQGNPNPEEEGGDPPPQVVFTNITHTIAVDSVVSGEGAGDIGVVGMTDDDPPAMLQPSINALGFNALTMPGMQYMDGTGTDQMGTGDDFGLLPVADYGGSVPSILPNNDPMNMDFPFVSPLIDAGDPMLTPLFITFRDVEGRGRHFTRYASTDPAFDPEIDVPIIDIGATEAQLGNFVVDSLFDESDNQFSRIWGRKLVQGQLQIFVGNPNVPDDDVVDAPFGPTSPYLVPGDFSLREAIDFSEKNPETDTISFARMLQGTASQLPGTVDPTFTLAPSILLGNNDFTVFEVPTELAITQSVNIEGPIGFEIEIDASGNDFSPSVNNADGTRVFNIDDGNLTDPPIDVLISNVTIMGGDVMNSGGGIRNLENLTLLNSFLRDNGASNDGGAIFAQIGDLTIDGTTFADNFAADDGGAVFLDTGLMGDAMFATISNSTFSNNDSGDRGGALLNSNATLDIRHSTFTLNNSAANRGDAIASLGSASGSTTIYSTIVSKNGSNSIFNDVEVFFGTGNNITSEGYNLIGGGNAISAFTAAGDVTGVFDPVLAPLQRTGGKTPTHRPVVGSPVIDTGEEMVTPGIDVPETDQRGGNFTRVFDGDGDTVARIDIGAYELQPSVIIVDNPEDENDGDTSLGNLSLREAIEISNLNPLNDVIMFDPGLLGETIVMSSEGSASLKPNTPADLRITDSVEIIGLGESFLTIDAGGATDQFGNPTRLFTIDDSDANNDLVVKIADLSISNFINTAFLGGVYYSKEDLTIERIFHVNNSTFDDEMHGGVIYQEGASLDIVASTFTANSTDGENADGGALYALNSDVTIRQDSSFSGNSTTQTLSDGGAIYVKGGSLNFTESSVTGNLAPGGSADGGGIFFDNTTAFFKDASISGNTMTGSNSEGAGIHSLNSTLDFVDSIVSLNGTTGTLSEGAGLYVLGGSATITSSTFAQNTTTGQLSPGAGLAINNAVVTVTGSSFLQNSTSNTNSSGGAIHNLGGTLTIRDSVIANNSVTGTGSDGGGVYSDTNLLGTQSTSVINSTVSGNSSNDRSGGIHNQDGLTTIAHSTITKNTAPFFGFGGGVGSLGSTATRTEVHSTIVSGNTGGDVDIVPGTTFNSFVSQGYNLVGNGLATANFNAAGDQTNVTNPMLGSLASNGGPTLNHAILAGSPAANAGDPSFTAGSQNPALTADQRGLARVQGGRIDIGSYESDIIDSDPADFNGDGITDGFDFLTWQRGFGSANTAKTNGNANGDGSIDGDDLTIWEGTYGDGSTMIVQAASSGGSGDTSQMLRASSELPPVVHHSTAETSAVSDDFSGLANYRALLVSGSQTDSQETVTESSLAERDAFLSDRSSDFDLRLLRSSTSALENTVADEADEVDETDPEEAFFAELGAL